MLRTALAVLVAVPCTILLLPAMAVGMVLRLFPLCVRTIARGFEPSFVPWTNLMQFDPLLGWKPLPNLNTHYLADWDDVFKVVTDADGWPGRSTIDASKIVVIGDSFAFGYGVDPERSFWGVDPALGIKAVGAPGYSMVQGVQLMQQLGPRLKEKVVVWFVYVENDLVDNLTPNMRGYRAPFVCQRDGRWEITNAHLSSLPWDCSCTNRHLWPMLAELCVPGAIADRAYSACGFLIGRAHSLCREAGAQLVVVSVPHPIVLQPSGIARLASMTGRSDEFDATLPDRRISDLCRHFEVPFVAGRDALGLADYKRREGIHWNERGHRRVAVLLRRLYHSFEKEKRSLHDDPNVNRVTLTQP